MRSVTHIVLLYVCIASGYAQINNCGLDKFRCRNGECIAGYLLCDGKADCRDASDETQSECKKSEHLCSSLAFRCNYGACIDGNLICNGFKDCIDNSDETLPQCDTPGIVNGSKNPSRCRSSEFRCDSGKCIPEIEACDGIRNCADGSDETPALCRSLPCSAFRCAYGACIDRNLRCNGAADCADSSDEDPQLCGSIWSQTPPPFPTPITHPSPPTRQPPTRQPPTRRTTQLPPPYSPRPTNCIAPPQPQNGRWMLHRKLCSGSGQDCVVPEGTELRTASQLIYSCNEGYKLNGSPNVICNFEGHWPTIPECTEIRCKALSSVSTKATCTYNGKWAPCESPVLPGTRATLRCEYSYRRESDLQSTFVICNEAGNWDPEPLQCIAACGRQPAINTPLIVGGFQPNITDFPWHASLYRGSSKTYSCGATIIKENLLITAAHCVYSEQDKRPINPTEINIMTGNIFRDFDFPHDETIVQKRKVKNIYMCFYIGSRGNYGSDIAILELDRPFELSAYLVPVCIDLFNDLPVIKQGDRGMVPGFGRTSPTSNSSAILQALEVPYVSIDECRSAAQNADTVQYVIPNDKFCAGYTNGSSACDGDSGSGLVFPINDLWYLQGVVSSSLGSIVDGVVVRCNNNLYTIFTRVSSHVPFIHNVIVSVDRRQQPICLDRGYH